jgi:hypothetical protein
VARGGFDVVVVALEPGHRRGKSPAPQPPPGTSAIVSKPTSMSLIRPPANACHPERSGAATQPKDPEKASLPYALRTFSTSVECDLLSPCWNPS